MSSSISFPQVSFRKPLVWVDFWPHRHAHCTHFNSVRRTHTTHSFFARMQTRTFFQKEIQKIFFLNLYLFLTFYGKKKCGCAHVHTKKVFYARTSTHNFKAPFAPECTKNTAPARVRARTHTKGVIAIGLQQNVKNLCQPS